MKSLSRFVSIALFLLAASVASVKAATITFDICIDSPTVGIRPQVLLLWGESWNAGVPTGNVVGRDSASFNPGIALEPCKRLIIPTTGAQANYLKIHWMEGETPRSAVVSMGPTSDPTRFPVYMYSIWKLNPGGTATYRNITTNWNR